MLLCGLFVFVICVVFVCACLIARFVWNILCDVVWCFVCSCLFCVLCVFRSYHVEYALVVFGIHCVMLYVIRCVLACDIFNMIV